jgi:hypothetical protein
MLVSGHQIIVQYAGVWTPDYTPVFWCLVSGHQIIVQHTVVWCLVWRYSPVFWCLVSGQEIIVHYSCVCCVCWCLVLVRRYSPVFWCLVSGQQIIVQCLVLVWGLKPSMLVSGLEIIVQYTVCIVRILVWCGLEIIAQYSSVYYHDSRIVFSVKFLMSSFLNKIMSWSQKSGMFENSQM